jgi:RND family efflux transporter MFP subunit
MSNPNDLLKELRIDRGDVAGRRPVAPLAVGAVVLVIALLGAAWWFFARNAVPEVRVASVRSTGGGGSASILDANGYVVARRMATVSAKITGKVREVLIEEGQKVEAGQIIATLDVIDASANRDLASAQQAMARSQVGNIEAQLREGEANVKRQQDLINQHFVSQAAYDQAVSQRDALVAQLASARDNARVAGEQLRIAGIGIDNTVVRAPFAGVVIAKSAQPGEIISPLSAGGGFTRTGIGTIVDMNSLEIEVDVNESAIGKVQPKMPVTITLNAYPNWPIPGEVIAIIPTADRGKATVKVRVGFKVRDERIVPDMGAHVSFLEPARPAAATPAQPTLLAPAAAIVNRGGADTVFVLNGDKVAMHKIRVGRTLGDEREVLDGLANGDNVVLEPRDDLTDGMRVTRLADKPADK